MQAIESLKTIIFRIIVVSFRAVHRPRRAAAAAGNLWAPPPLTLDGRRAAATADNLSAHVGVFNYFVEFFRALKDLAIICF